MFSCISSKALPASMGLKINANFMNMLFYGNQCRTVTIVILLF
jgi:hypothetical protein